MVTVSCACGWRATAPSKIQAQVEFDKHQRHDCKVFSTCSICTEIAQGKLRPPEPGDDRQRFVCDRCFDEHPRDGNYGFGSLSDPSRAMGTSRKGGKK